MKCDNAIGGYLSFDMDTRDNQFKHDVKLNSARNAFKLILLEIKPRKIFIPAFLCGVMHDLLLDLKVSFELYFLNEDFSPDLNDDSLLSGEYILFVNYFGVNDDVVNDVIDKYGRERVIVDAAQALYFTPETLPVAVIYSPRKFVGLPDGGVIRTKMELDESYSRDTDSYLHLKHLGMRFDNPAEKGYRHYKAAEKRLSSQPIKRMSYLTELLFDSYSHERIKNSRISNFSFLDERLSRVNQLKFRKKYPALVYPLLIENGWLIKRKLIKNKVFVPTYWPDISLVNECGNFERTLLDNLIAIPCDQRYSQDDFEKIISLIT